MSLWMSLSVLLGLPPKKEESKTEYKLTKEQEHGIVKTAGATQIYSRLEKEMQKRMKQNCLLFGVAMFCFTLSSNTH